MSWRVREHLIGDGGADLTKRVGKRLNLAALPGDREVALHHIAELRLEDDGVPGWLSRNNRWSWTQTWYAVLVGDITTSWRSSAITSYIQSTIVRSSLRQTALSWSGSAASSRWCCTLYLQ